MPKIMLLMLLIVPLCLCAQTDAEQYLQNYLRVRSDLSGKDSVYHIQGRVYSLIPGEKSMEIFAYEGYQISRIEDTDAGYRLLGKEVGYFQDHRTRQILHTWRNPFTQETLPIIHIWNDPVNQLFEYSADTMPFIRQFIPSTVLGERLVYHKELFPFYPHVLSRRLYGDYVQSEYFQSAELNEYSVRLEDLADSLSTSLPAEISFTWVAPWLPFMKMGDRPGAMLFVCRGIKLEGGFFALPRNIIDYVIQHKPDFAQAPAEYQEPNMTPWTYFRNRSESSQGAR